MLILSIVAAGIILWVLYQIADFVTYLANEGLIIAPIALISLTLWAAWHLVR